MLISRRGLGMLSLRHLAVAAAAGLSVAILSADQALATPPPSCASPPSALLNGSFESPAGPLNYVVVGLVAVGAPGLAWSTTDPTQVVEVWDAAAMGLGAAPAGARIAELMANNPSILYQTLTTVPAQRMVWRLRHRGRNGAETMQVKIGDPASVLAVQLPTGQATSGITDGTSSWGTATGTYTVPGGQTATRIALESVVPATGSQGNLLDDVEFTVAATACDDTATTAANQSVTIPVAANDLGVVVAVSNPTTPAHGSVTMVAGSPRYAPDADYAGTDAFTYTLTDADANTATAQVTVTVTAPALTAPGDVVSSGVGTATQTRTLAIPPSGQVRLLHANSLVTGWNDPGVGTYTLDASTGVVSFAPVLGYAGTPAGVGYRITDRYAQTGDAAYIPTVSIPSAPVAEPLASTGGPAAAQARIVAVPAGGHIVLLDEGDHAVQRLTVDGQGEYVLDAQQGVITFVPRAGFTGKPRAVRYRTTDAYGQSSEASYQPEVEAQVQAAPAPASCFSRRSETIHWKVRPGQKLRWIKVAIAGQKAASLRRSVRSVTVDLRGRPKQVVKLLITARTTKGRSLAQTRTYRTCSARMPHRPLPTLRLTPAARV